MPKKTISLGELICAVYDEVSATTSKRAEAARLATIATVDFLIRSRNTRLVSDLSGG